MLLSLHKLSADLIEPAPASTEPFPTDLDNEMLADTIRGNVKVNVHSYQVRQSRFRFVIIAILLTSPAFSLKTVDFDLMARLTNGSSLLPVLLREGSGG